MLRTVVKRERWYQGSYARVNESKSVKSDSW